MVRLNIVTALYSTYFILHLHYSVPGSGALLFFLNSLINKTLGRALDPRANGTWLSKLTE